MGKKLIIIMCSIFLLSGCKSKNESSNKPTDKPDENILLGDVNDDGVVDMEDLNELQKYLANPESTNLTDTGLKNADVNQDGIINQNDYSELMAMLDNDGVGFKPLE